jgi:DNA (cytosine-5)-methyltransferase 1
MPKKYLTVKEVARLLGVTPLTVRNWDKKGVLVAYRNPVNNYRLYKVEDVEELIRKIETPPEQPQKIPVEDK